MYTFSDVLLLRTIADLLARGVEVKKLRVGLQKARREAARWIDIRAAPRRYLVTGGTDLFVRDQGKLESATMNGQLAFAFVLDLRLTHKAVARAWPKRVEPIRRRRPA